MGKNQSHMTLFFVCADEDGRTAIYCLALDKSFFTLVVTQESFMECVRRESLKTYIVFFYCTIPSFHLDNSNKAVAKGKIVIKQ